MLNEFPGNAQVLLRMGKTCRAATKAFLVNAVADVGLLFGIILTFATFDTLDIRQILNQAHNFSAGSNLQQMQHLVSDPNTDLLAQIPHGKSGHTVLREALLVADHNAYHIGQLVTVRRSLGAW